MVLETAVVGGGTVSDIHLAGVQRRPEAALVAVCDPDEARARETAKAYDVNAYADFEGMLAREELDWIHLCTPVQTRLDLAEMALEDGVPVQIERPVTPTAREARELARLASAYETDVSVVHSRNFDPAVREAEAMVDDGVIGAVRSVELRYTVDEQAERDTRGGRASELPGGVVDAVLPDPIALVLHVGGYPTDTDAIQAAATRSRAEERVTQYDGATFQYTSEGASSVAGRSSPTGSPASRSPSTARRGASRSISSPRR